VNISNLRGMNVKRGLTEGFLFQFQGLPGQNESTPVTALASQVNVFTCKRYAYYLRAGGFDQGVLRFP